MAKTAAAVLQEMAIKAGTVPEYECVSQSGPQHRAVFEFHCTVFGETATAVANSKKEGKQEVSRALLVKLARSGHSVPAPWGQAVEPSEPPAENPYTIHSYVALLREYCEEFRLPVPTWDLIGDSGPPHLRNFTVRVSVGAHAREATAHSKKAARQAAAHDIYKYLRGCLRSTQEFVEADAIARHVDKRMRPEEVKELAWRPPLDQRLSEYQCGLALQFDEERRTRAAEALTLTAEDKQPPTVQLECAAAVLGLEPVWDTMPTITGPPYVTVELPTTSPPLLHIGRDRDHAASLMVSYLKQFLLNPPRDPLLEFQEEAERLKREQTEAERERRGLSTYVSMNGPMPL